MKSIAVTLLLLVLAACAPAQPVSSGPPPVNSSLFFEPGFYALSSSAQTAWLSYGAARIAYLQELGVPMRIGQLDPGFEEEVLGREAMARAWRAHREDLRPPPPDAYLDDLASVTEAGYLREYVWTYLHRAAWGSSPPSLDLDGFGAWREIHLDRHVPLTLVGVGTLALGL